MRLATDSLDLAREHLAAQSDTDLFPRPFEIEAISSRWRALCRQPLAGDMRQWRCSASRRCLVPKHRYGFRVATQLDPLDCLVLTAVIAEFGADIEAMRVPVDDQVCFSHRFSPDRAGRLYNTAFTYQTFLDAVRHRLEDRRYTYVVVTDIADFYPRLYLHPLENALRATGRTDHAAVVIRMIKQLNANVSYGVPVGPRAVHLLAEAALDAVDRSLLAERVEFCRYVDDYVVFARGRREAYVALALLAGSLFEIHGLTLQPHKTKIRATEDYLQEMNRFETGPVGTMVGELRRILRRYGVDYDPYERIDYQALPLEARQEIERLNLPARLRDALGAEDIDVNLAGFLLQRLTQLGRPDLAEEVMGNAERLYPVFSEAVRYLTEVTREPTAARRLRDWLLAALTDEVVSHLDFHRLWILRALAWNDERMPGAETLTDLYAQYADEFSRRELLLALGRRREHAWFFARRRSWQGLGAWERRAFLYGASCMPRDQYAHWCRSQNATMTPLERAVSEWASDSPI